MRLKLTRTGGFAGISPPPVEVDTAALPKEVARHIESLVAGAKFFELPKTIKSAQPQPDRFRYSLQITLPDGREHTIVADEEAVTPGLFELVRAMQTLKIK